jgi:hypothetical protein
VPTTPSKSLSLYIANVQKLIAASPSWQTWTKHAGDAAAAQESVYLVGVTPPASRDGTADNKGYTPEDFDELRPFCVVNYSFRDGYEGSQEAVGTFVERARVMFSFEDTVPDGDLEDYNEAVLSFLENVGKVIADLQEAAGVDGNCNLHDIRMEKPPMRADQTERAARGDYHVVIFSAEVGI